MEKENFIMWDAINGDFYEHESLDSVLKDLKENYCDPEEGIHPDIETIMIFKEVADVVVEKVDGKETYRVNVTPREDNAQQKLLAAEKEIERLNKLNRAHQSASETKTKHIRNQEKEIVGYKNVISKMSADRVEDGRQLQRQDKEIADLKEGLRKIEQMSDPGSPERGITYVKNIASQLLTQKI